MAKAKNLGKSWSVEIIGQADGPFSGAQPQEIDALIEKPDKDVKTLKFQIVKAQVELLCQKGDTLSAVEALKKYEETQFSYACPLNVFQKDIHNGNWPFMGGYCFYGAFRDAANQAFKDQYNFWKNQADNNKKLPRKRLRNYVHVRPHHVFFYRPDINGKPIEKVDNMVGQQPIEGGSKGFARYEVIEPPFQFKFRVDLMPLGPFAKALTDRDLVKATIYQAVNHGLLGRRAVGYGMWHIESYKELT